MTIHHDVKMSGEQNKPVPWSLRQAICEKVVAVSHDEKLSTVIPQIAAGDVASLVAVRDGEAVGVVAVGNLERAPAESMVADVCSPIRGLRANPDLLLSVGEQLFRDETVELISLYEPEEHLAGFVTRGSLASAAIRETENLRAWMIQSETQTNHTTAVRASSSAHTAALPSVTRDVTDRVLAEKQIRDNEQRLRKIFNGLPYYLTLFTVDGRLSLVNQTALQSPGFAVEELEGKQIWETEWIKFDPAVQEGVRTAFVRAQNGLGSRFDSPIRLPTGEMKHMEITVYPVCDDDGIVREILGAGVDITARVEAEEQARRFRDEIAHASRLSTLGEMAANIAHELNQPLAAIVNYAFSARTLLADIAGPDSGRCAQYLSVVEEQSLRAGHIVRSLQQLVRKTRSHHGAADLGRIFEDVLSLIKSDLYHERIELVTNFSPDLPVILVDSVQIQQVVLNLVRNSIEALAGVDGGRRIEIATQQQDDRVLVSVSDSGPGIPDAPFDNIFDAFVSTKPDGLGLGLTISRRIIDAHGGELWYESPAGRGATFSFTLPVSHQKETDE